MNVLDNLTLNEIKSIYTVSSIKGRSLSISNRPYYALTLSRGDGVIIYTQDGERTVSDRKHAVIIPMGASYTLRNKEGGDFPIINFCTAEPFTDKFLSFELSNPSSYIKDFERMESLWTVDRNRNKVMSIMYDVLYRIARENEPSDPVLSRLDTYIAENIQNPELSNTELASVIKVSESYFRRLFKQRYGVTPKKYILTARINKAKELLEERAMSIGNIADVCGFSSVYHFSRAFKLASGMTPSEYSGKRLDKEVEI